MDVRNESDIEQLRRIALTQETQIRHLLDALQSKCKTIDELRGDEGELQQTIAMLNELQACSDAKPSTSKPKKRKKKRPPSEAGAGNARKNRAMKPRQATLDGTKEHDD